MKLKRARQCVSLQVNAVLAGRGMRARAQGPETEWSGDQSPETKRSGDHQRKCRASATYTCKAFYKAVQGGWVGGFQMKPQVWVKARSKTATA